jgi:hypothetical protein
MPSVAAFLLDFGPIGPLIILGILALLLGLAFVAGTGVGALIAFFFLRRRKSRSP